MQNQERRAMTSDNLCCFVDDAGVRCASALEWEVFDARDARPDAPSATHVCTGHVGAVLGDSESLTAEMRALPQQFIVVPVESGS